MLVRDGTPVKTGDRAVSWARWPAFPSTSARCPIETLTIPLIQKHFFETMVFQQSVALTD
jgi:hypothetical protein